MAIAAATGLAPVAGAQEDSVPHRGLYEVRGDTATIGSTGWTYWGFPTGS